MFLDMAVYEEELPVEVAENQEKLGYNSRLVNRKLEKARSENRKLPWVNIHCYGLLAEHGFGFESFKSFNHKTCLLIPFITHDMSR